MMRAQCEALGQVDLYAIQSLLQRLLAHGFRVRALSRAQPTLEDVFLAATRRSWDAKLAPLATPAGTANGFDRP